MSKEEKELPAVANSTGLVETQTGLAVPADFMGFTPEDALGGMDEVYQGYAKQYPFFLRSNNAGQFELRDNASDNVVYTSELGEKIKCVVIYAHHSRVLLKGYKDMRTDDVDAWPEEAKEVLAMSYDDKSPGNFKLNGLEAYLSKPLREAVKTKLNMIIVAPDLPSGQQPIFCSFGITSDDYKRPHTLASMRLDLDQFNRKNGTNIPLNFLITEMFFVADSDKSGKKKYQRAAFQLQKNKDGVPVPAFGSAEVYRKHIFGWPLLQDVIARHKKAVASKEQDFRPAPVASLPEAQPYNADFDDIPM